MITIAFFIFCIFAFPRVLATPTALDAGTLLQNGQAAQQLNAEFENLKVTDPCNTGATACITGFAAECLNGAWQTQVCSGGSRQCFALPSVRSNGTFLACTSEANALSLIYATGAEGGLTSNITSNGTDPCTSSDSGSSTTTSTNRGGTVTVTIILQPGSTVMLPPTTRTINPTEASSLIGNLAIGDIGDMGPFLVTATPSATSTMLSSIKASLSVVPDSGVGSPIPLSRSTSTSAMSTVSSTYSSYRY